jgi:hypothetical protein
MENHKIHPRMTVPLSAGLRNSSEGMRSVGVGVGVVVRPLSLVTNNEHKPLR